MAPARTGCRWPRANLPGSTCWQRRGESYLHLRKYLRIISPGPTVHLAAITIETGDRRREVQDPALAPITPNRGHLAPEITRNIDHLMDLLNRRPDFVSPHSNFQSFRHLAQSACHQARRSSVI